MNKIKYDKTLVTKVLEELPGDLNQKAVSLARIYGVYREVYGSLSEGGPYRGADIVSILTKAVEDKNNRELSIEKENLEDLVNSVEIGKVNNLIVAYEICKEIIDKSIRYSIYGVLPGRFQKKIAEKNGEDALNYSLYNLILDSSAGVTGLIYGCITDNPYIGCSGVVMFTWDAFRSGHYKFDKKPTGSLLTTIPYYSIVLPYRAIKYLTKSIKDKFVSKKKELASKNIRIEVMDEPKQLPSPLPHELEVSLEEGQLSR